MWRRRKRRKKAPYSGPIRRDTLKNKWELAMICHFCSPLESQYLEIPFRACRGLAAPRCKKRIRRADKGRCWSGSGKNQTGYATRSYYTFGAEPSFAFQKSLPRSKYNFCAFGHGDSFPGPSYLWSRQGYCQNPWYPLSYLARHHRSPEQPPPIFGYIPKIPYHCFLLTQFGRKYDAQHVHPPCGLQWDKTPGGGHTWTRNMRGHRGAFLSQ